MTRPWQCPTSKPTWGYFNPEINERIAVPRESVILRLPRGWEQATMWLGPTIAGFESPWSLVIASVGLTLSTGDGARFVQGPGQDLLPLW